MNHIKLSPSFFKNEAQMYRSPIMAFWRENLQNSYDAGSTKIDIRIEDDNGLKKITFADNGKGMDLDTLENVYFVLGESTKRTDSQSVGGFGRARLLTCFSQEKYELRTRNNFIQGQGSSWENEIVDTYYKGVELTVWMDTNADVKDILQRYLNTCHLNNTVVTIDGQRWSDWTYKNKHERSLSFGEVFTNKSKSAGLYVRVNGVTMFQPYMTAPFLIILEIHQSSSRSVLQANRDGLLQEYQTELESFINDLNINKQSALRKNKSKSTEYKGTGTFTARRIKKPTGADVADMFAALIADSDAEIAPDGIADLKSTIENAKDPEAFAKVLIQRMKDVGTQFTAPKESAAPVHNSGYHEDSDRQYMSFEMFDTIIVDDTSNAAVRKVIESYYPQNFDLTGSFGSRFDKRYGEFRSFRAGIEKYKLLVMWRAAVEEMICLMQDVLQRGEAEIGWGVGWCFSDEAQAKHKSMNGVNWILLNPCDTKGRMRFSISVKRDLIKIISNAAHEVVHIVAPDHDEVFGNLLNDLLEEAMANLGDIIAKMKKAKEVAVNQLELVDA